MLHVRTLFEKYVNYSYSLVVPFPIHIFYPFPGAIKRTACDQKGGYQYQEPFFHDSLTLSRVGFALGHTKSFQ